MAILCCVWVLCFIRFGHLLLRLAFSRSLPFWNSLPSLFPLQSHPVFSLSVFSVCLYVTHSLTLPPPRLFSLSSLSLSPLPEPDFTDNRLLHCNVLVTVCGCSPFNGCPRRSLYSTSFYLEYLLDVSMTWCSWRVTGDSVARDTRDVSRITTDHHTQVLYTSLMLLRFLWCRLLLCSSCILLYVGFVFIFVLMDALFLFYKVLDVVWLVFLWHSSFWRQCSS